MQEHPSANFDPSVRPWSRVLWIGLAVFALLLAGAYFVSAFLLNAYLHSEAFRVFLNKKTSGFFHADGQYMPVQWSGFSFYSDGYQARGEAGSPFSELRAEQIRAEFYPQGIFHQAWQINDIQIQRLKIGFGQISAGGVAAVEAATFPEVIETPRSSWIPNRLEIRHAQIQETELGWSFPNGDGGIRGMRVMLEPEGTALRAGGFGGELFQAGFPALKIDHLKIRYQHPDLFITDALFKLGDSENLGLSGQASLDRGGELDLRPVFNGVSITQFLPEDWRARLHGNAGGEAVVKGRVGDPDSLRVTGKLNLAGGQIEALPVLDKIAAFTRTEQFRRIALQKAAADFSWTKTRCDVTNLVLESEGLIRVEGGFVLERGNIDGVFMVGVTPSSLRWLPGSQERVFKQERAGFVWTSVRISGPVGAVKEDLSPRLISAAKEQIINDVKGSVEKGTQGVFDLLTPLLR
jgi:hypothetical protein